MAIKSEWVTDNIKRAYTKMWGGPDYHHYNRFVDRDLQGAIDLLIYVAERADITISFGAFRNISMKERWYVVAGIGRGLQWQNGSTESLLHAILLAVDQIVDWKPEVFK